MHRQEFHHRLIHAGSFTVPHVIHDDQPASGEAGRKVVKTLFRGFISIHIQVAEGDVTEVQTLSGRGEESLNRSGVGFRGEQFCDGFISRVRKVAGLETLVLSPIFSKPPFSNGSKQ